MAARDGILRRMATRPAWQGFDYDLVDVEDYDELRPGYSPEGVDWMIRTAGLPDHALVIELAAGTGKLTRLLVGASLSVFALEPSAMMRRVLSRNAGDAVISDGTAESIPAPTASCEAVVAAQAFHHFDTARAAAEIRRVLRPRGALILFWTTYDEDDPVKGALDEVYARFGDRLVSAKMGSWREGLAATELFDQADEASFPHPHSIASSALSRLYATSSDVASLPPARRLRLLGAIDELGRRLPERLSIAASTCVEIYRGRP